MLKGGLLMGFLKFLGAIAMMIIGFLGIVGSFLGCLNSGISSTIIGGKHSDTPFVITAIIAVIIFLGGIYILRRKV
jgi:hypothetical protein